MPQRNRVLLPGIILAILVSALSFGCASGAPSRVGPTGPNLTSQNDADTPLELEGIFVAPPAIGGDDSNAGDAEHPVAHVSVALEKAKAAGLDAVYVACGAYTENATLNLVDGTSVFGGCDPQRNWSWDAPRGPCEVHFTAHSECGAVYGENITSATVISRLGIHAAPGMSSRPDSTAVHLKNCGNQLRFCDCAFFASNGADGTIGADGDGGAPGEIGGDGEGGFCCFGWYPSEPAPLPGLGGGGDICDNWGGDGGRLGVNDSSGWPGSGGAPGGDHYYFCGGKGGDGAMGSAGADGSGGDECGEIKSDGIWVGSDGGSGGDGGCGFGGGGGGVGSSGSALQWGVGPIYAYGGAGGGGGGGGYGGQGGAGGSGGGGSFCVFLDSSSPSFENCTFQVGNGGDGGHGGNGGEGGHGGQGGLGGCGYYADLPGGGGNYDMYIQSGPGGSGGWGGFGGRGGHGGGGGGGVSYCVYCCRDSQPTIDAECVLIAGQGGKGGGAHPEGCPGEDGRCGEIF